MRTGPENDASIYRRYTLDFTPERARASGGYGRSRPLHPVNVAAYSAHCPAGAVTQHEKLAALAARLLLVRGRADDTTSGGDDDHHRPRRRQYACTRFRSLPDPAPVCVAT